MYDYCTGTLAKILASAPERTGPLGTNPGFGPLMHWSPNALYQHDYCGGVQMTWDTRPAYMRRSGQIIACRTAKTITLLTCRMVPCPLAISQLFAQSQSRSKDYMEVRSYNSGVGLPLLEEQQYTLSSGTGREELVVDSAISSERIIGGTSAI